MHESIWVEVAAGLTDKTWRLEIANIVLPDYGISNEEIEALALDQVEQRFDPKDLEFVHVLQIEPDSFN